MVGLAHSAACSKSLLSPGVRSVLLPESGPIQATNDPQKLLRLAFGSLILRPRPVLPGLPIVSAVFSLRSVSGAGYTQTAVRRKLLRLASLVSVVLACW